VINFSISALEKAPVKKSGSLPGEFLDLDEADAFAAAGEVVYDLTAMIVSGGVLVSGSISAPVSSCCGRCLKDIQLRIAEEKLELFFELDSNQEILTVDEDLRAELLLNLPMNPVCSDDCQGLCPVCGIDLNEKSCNCDTRSSAGEVSPWSALDALDL
jgi:uncharacterized protein